jgi:hypothetical protein
MEGKNFLDVQTRTTAPVRVGETAVVLESRSVTIPFPNGGVVYQWPTAVYAYTGLESERIPIYNVTRTAVIGISAFFMTAAFMYKIMFRGK